MLPKQSLEWSLTQIAGFGPVTGSSRQFTQDELPLDHTVHRAYGCSGRKTSFSALPSPIWSKRRHVT
ncbi:hypothetical protein L13192_02600 [Pyrenophora tritici-repentis]|nr:hypothetical protein L13192_02600 [Pyrenophora tritici-repentis]KAI1686969.1 hypothetical protein KJE20_00146 [Pyrenophora tritici-repentis]